MNDDLIAVIIEVIATENLARYTANAAEPYDDADYRAHEERLNRLVDAVADGDTVLADRFCEALFDITHDGADWTKKVFFVLQCEREVEHAELRAS